MDRESQEGSSRLDVVEVELADWITVRVLGGQLLLLAIGLAVLLVKLWWLRRREPARLFERGSRVQQLLAQILEVANADRVVLYEVIHSGSWRLFGGALFRCCITSEVCRPGVSPLQDREIPLERLWAEWNDLKGGRLHRYRLREASPGCRAYMLRVGVAEQWSKVLARGETPVGFLAIQFLDARRREVPAKLFSLLSLLEGSVGR
jgi:hypothetical protein